jgi:hypothetical protein
MKTFFIKIRFKDLADSVDTVARTLRAMDPVYNGPPAIVRGNDVEMRVFLTDIGVYPIYQRLTADLDRSGFAEAASFRIFRKAGG